MLYIITPKYLYTKKCFLSWMKNSTKGLFNYYLRNLCPFLSLIRSYQSRFTMTNIADTSCILLFNSGTILISVFNVTTKIKYLINEMTPPVLSVIPSLVMHYNKHDTLLITMIIHGIFILILFPRSTAQCSG